MCTRNGEAFLSDQLQSLARQHHLPLELIVCDDVSDDGTVAMLEAFAEDAPFPVRIVKNQKRMGSTLNFGSALSLCSGDLIALCDQDDIWYPNKIKVLTKALEDTPEAGFAFSDADLIGQDGRSLGRTLWQVHSAASFRWLRSGFPPRIQGELLVRQNLVTGATLVFRGTLRPLVLPLTGELIHDYWIALSLVLSGWSGIAVDQHLIGYRQHANQQVGVDNSFRARFRRLALTPSSAPSSKGFCALRAHLRDYLIGTPFFHQADKLLEDKINHLEVRQGARNQAMMKRLLAVGRELTAGRYHRWSNSWSSALSDIIGPEIRKRYHGRANA